MNNLICLSSNKLDMDVYVKKQILIKLYHYTINFENLINNNLHSVNFENLINKIGKKSKYLDFNLTASNSSKYMKMARALHLQDPKNTIH